MAIMAGLILFQIIKPHTRVRQNDIPAQKHHDMLLTQFMIKNSLKLTHIEILLGTLAQDMGSTFDMV